MLCRRAEPGAGARIGDRSFFRKVFYLRSSVFICGSFHLWRIRPKSREFPCGRARRLGECFGSFPQMIRLSRWVRVSSGIIRSEAQASALMMRQSFFLAFVLTMMLPAVTRADSLLYNGALNTT